MNLPATFIVIVSFLSRDRLSVAAACENHSPMIGKGQLEDCYEDIFDVPLQS